MAKSFDSVDLFACPLCDETAWMGKGSAEVPTCVGKHVRPLHAEVEMEKFIPASAARETVEAAKDFSLAVEATHVPLIRALVRLETTLGAKE